MRVGQFEIDLPFSPARSWNLSGWDIYDQANFGAAGGLGIGGVNNAFAFSTPGQGVEVSGARLVVVAPTIVHLMGLPIPGDMDGHVLDDLLEGGGPAAVVSGPEAAPQAGTAEGGLTQEEEQELLRRLTDLGYIG